MPLDSAFLLKVKEHVSAKLKSLGAFIDEELPDYIMVMVANKKSESSMTKDLQLFLGDHTVEFTRWLHSTLEKLRNRGKAKTKDIEGDSSSNKSKFNKRKANKPENSGTTGVTPVHRPHFHSRSRSRSPIPKTVHEMVSSREPHDSEVFTISVEDDYCSDGISSSVAVKEERKVVSTASLMCREQLEEEDAIIDSTQENQTLRSIVKVKGSEVKHRPRVSRTLAGSLQPSGRLLKQAVNEAKASARKADDGHPTSHTKHVTSDHPVAYGDVSSSGTNSDRTKFFVTLSGAERAQGPPSVASVVDSSATSSRKSDIDLVTRVSNVKARLGDRRVLPYSRPKPLSAKQRLGPVTHNADHRSRISDVSREDIDDIVELEEPYMDDLDLVQEVDISDEPFPSSVDSRTVGVEKVRLVDRLNQKQLVVTLNDVDDEDDLVPLAAKKKPSHQVSTEDVAQSEDQVKIPSSLDRCKYWPKCRNGDQCQFIHPTEPCSTFPRCRLGDRCIYIHPTCRYDGSCTRDDCPFAHSTKRLARPAVSVLPSVSPSQVVCRFQGRCTNVFCPFYHPSVQPLPRLIAVRPFTNTARVTATQCRFGVNCVNSSCPFSHPGTPKPDRLKWVAPSKQQSTQAVPKPAVSAAKTTSVPTVIKSHPM